MMNETKRNIPISIMMWYDDGIWEGTQSAHKFMDGTCWHSHIITEAIANKVMALLLWHFIARLDAMHTRMAWVDRMDIIIWIWTRVNETGSNTNYANGQF